MKKKLLTVVLLFIAYISNSQIRLGFTQDNIQFELSQLNIVYEVGKTDDGTIYTMFLDGKDEVIHYYSKDTCILGVVIPPTLMNCIVYKNNLDLNFSKLSDSVWIDGDITIMMITFQDRFMFLFK